MTHLQHTNNEPPPYEQIYSLPTEQPGFPEATRITSITKSIIHSTAQPKFDRTQLRLRLSKFYSQACSISKYGIAPPKHLNSSYSISPMNNVTSRPSQTTCSHTTGISKSCRGCLEGERCNQLG